MVESVGAVRTTSVRTQDAPPLLSATLPVRAAAAWRQLRLPDWLTLALSYLTLTLLLRALLIGNPVIHIDEQFYLLVGDRMLHGAVPYVDIWDRKPIGLFLLFELFHLFPGDGVVTYQLAGVVSTVATAMVIERLSREIAPRAGAWQAGFAYILFMPVFNCVLGQAPVFFNLPVALAAWAVVDTLKRLEDPQLLWRGAGIMALVGIAMQIKYTVVFEGVAFGALLLGRAYADVWSWKKLGAAALLWIAAALAPTALALGIYGAMGHAGAFMQANFFSIMSRQSDGEAWWRLTKEMLTLAPFWLAIFHAPHHLAMTDGSYPRARHVLRAWGMAAFAGFLAFGTWYDHYVGPLLAPLCILAAPALGRQIRGEKWYARFMLGLGAIGGVVVPAYQFYHHGTLGDVEHATSLIRAELGDGCFYMNEGDPVLYQTTNACLATSYIFPTHLAGAVESRSLGIDVEDEMRRIMARRPSVVMVGVKPLSRPANQSSRALLMRLLDRDYETYATVAIGTRNFRLYRLKPVQPEIAPRPAADR